MELVFLNYKIGEEDINLVVHHNIITGVINDVDNTLYNLLGLKKIGKGQIVINNQKISREDVYMNRKRIAQVPDINIFPSYLKTVEDLMNDHFRLFCLNVKNPLKKIKDSLKIVGLDEEYIYRDLVSLSSSERKLVTIALGLLSNPDTIILEEPFKFLDMKQEKRLYMLLEKLKEQYNKTIIIKTEDAEVIYKYTDEVILVKNNQILLDGNTKEVFQRVDYLKRNGVLIPDIVMFTYLAKRNKEVKIDYHRDIRDLIKDIYKHV